ncbi:alpha/beta hydrolase [Streptomyces sp. VNUA24]|uniref:alpha/beta hydrolase n=1 Tax=Streptomyces sp. VNUA24 TaxID=3031131 RepID=UPI0023B78DB4|nr:alpha/beta hydrolase [Streptomyces sp. VNUA24]WEH12955.1 alpha/beta hydrolase [Streptomyces sp. VNUA24]
MRNDIEFRTTDGTLLRGWHYVPEGPGPFPTVVMATGLSGVKEGGRLPDLAERFAAAGLAAVVYDHRNLGTSQGTPRQEIDPLLQMRDYSDAVTFAETLPQTDPERIGAWGSSLSGGHVIVLAGQDRRVRAIVAQVPMVSGRECGQRLVPAPALAAAAAFQRADRRARMVGETPAMIPVASPDPTAPAALPTPDSWEFVQTHNDLPTYRNEVTLRSMELLTGYEPGLLIERVSPTPMLMIVADDDLVCPPELQFAAYSRAHEPKKYVSIRGGHFDVYRDAPAFDRAAEAAVAFFTEHLGAAG